MSKIENTNKKIEEVKERIKEEQNKARVEETLELSKKIMINMLNN